MRGVEYIEEPLIESTFLARLAVVAYTYQQGSGENAYLEKLTVPRNCEEHRRRAEHADYAKCSPLLFWLVPEDVEA